MSGDKCPTCGGDTKEETCPDVGHDVAPAEITCGTCGPWEAKRVIGSHKVRYRSTAAVADMERELEDQMQVNADFNTECVKMDKQLTAANAVVEAVMRGDHAEAVRLASKLQGGS